MKFNAARYAIVYAVMTGHYKKLWLPVYMCPSVYAALDRYKVEYSQYHIDKNFMPILQDISDDECILIVNYYGIQPKRFYGQMAKKYKNIIFDNTQCFFASPYMREGVYNVYSPRKFVGVSDGAYLIAKKLERSMHLERDYSARRALFLAMSIETGTNENYEEYIEAERDITDVGMKAMSKYTERLLCNIDYIHIKKIRKENFDFLHEKLGKINLLNDFEQEINPMVYPLLFRNNSDKVRKYLVDNHLYVPQWWKQILQSDNSNDVERELSHSIFPLPIDQRYSQYDMDCIVEIVLKACQV